VSDAALYRFFFRHLATLDQVAAQLDSQGKSGDGLRTHEQRFSGLTEGEGASLKQVAYDCNQAVKAVETKAQAAVKAQTVPSPGGRNLSSPAALATRAQARADISGIVNSHIDQLRTALGDASFEKLDAYVKATVQAIATIPSSGKPLASATKLRHPFQSLVGGAQ
jgi:hypothetical protein